jgi:hypothetical protein
VRDVVVEVTTHHNNRVHILFDDILDDISHSVCFILLELLLTRFKVAVEYLNLVPSCCHPRPAEVCSQCLHQCQSHFVGCCCPDSSISLQHRLMRPVDWYRQLGLIQTHQLEVLSVNEITDHLLLLFSIEASDVEAHHGNFLQLLQYFVVSSLLVVSSVRCFVGWCCSSVRILTLPRFCCVVVAPVFELLSPPRFCCGFVAPVFELLSSPRFCFGGILMSAFFSSSLTVADRSFLSFFLWYVAFAGVPFFEGLEPIYRCSCSGV